MGAALGFSALTQVEEDKDGVGDGDGKEDGARDGVGGGDENEEKDGTRNGVGVKDDARGWAGTELTWDRCSALGQSLPSDAGSGEKAGAHPQPMSGTSTVIQVSQGHYGPTPAHTTILAEPMLAQQTAFICPISQPVCTGGLFYRRITLNCAPFGSPLGEKSKNHKGGVTLLSSFSKTSVRHRAGPQQSPPDTPTQTGRTPNFQDTPGQPAGNVGADSGQLNLRFLLN